MTDHILGLVWTEFLILYRYIGEMIKGGETMTYKNNTI